MPGPLCLKEAGVCHVNVRVCVCASAGVHHPVRRSPVILSRLTLEPGRVPGFLSPLFGPSVKTPPSCDAARAAFVHREGFAPETPADVRLMKFI